MPSTITRVGEIVDMASIGVIVGVAYLVITGVAFVTAMVLKKR